MRNFFVISLIVIVLVCGGYYYINQQENQIFISNVAFIEKSLPGFSLTYKTYYLNIFSNYVAIDTISFKDNEGHVYTADRVTVPIDLNNPLKHITFDNLNLKVNKDPEIKIKRCYIDNFQYSFGQLKIADHKITKIDFTKFKFDHAKLENITIVWSDPELIIKIGSYEIQDYGVNRKTDNVMQNIDMERNTSKDYFKIANIHIDGFDLATILNKVQNKNSEPFSLIQSAPRLFQINQIHASWSQEPWEVEKIESQLVISSNNDVKWTGAISAKQFPLYRFFYWDSVGYMLQMLHYNIVNVSGNIQADYTKKDNFWIIHPLIIKIKDLGDLTLNTKFKQPESIDWQDFKWSPLSPMRREYKYVALSAILQNKGFVERIIEVMSKEDKLSLIEERQTIIKNLQEDVAEAEYPLQRDAKRTLVGVVTNPNSPIMIDFKSKTPISFEEFNDRTKDQQFDGLDITIKN